MTARRYGAFVKRIEYEQERRYPRHAVRLRVEFPAGEGMTRDISVGGIYFETRTPLAEGERIRLRLVLQSASEAPIAVECEGMIVRVEGDGDQIGVAATIEGFDTIGAAAGIAQPPL
jgi:hypothetical protein